MQDNISEYKDFDIIDQESTDFFNLFREKSGGNLIKGLKPEHILSELGFRKVQFNDLSEELKASIKKTAGKNWYGYPLNKSERAKTVQQNNNEIFINNAGDVVYFINDNARGDYSWSKIEKNANGYRIHQFNHDNNIGEMLELLIWSEIKNRQNPKLFPGGRAGIEVPTTVFVEKTRGEIADIK
jgi:hypothetical protein